MTIANAIKKLSKYATVNQDRNTYRAVIGKYEVSFSANGENIPTSEITCERCRRVSDRDEIHADYFGGSYFDNLTRAINFAIEQNTRETSNPASVPFN